jgi:hypothetical protein
MKREQYPWIDTRYLEEITDDFSIWQHSHPDTIAREHGYALDDATRALLVAAAYQKPELGERYFHFIHHACCSFAHPVNFFTEHRQAIPGPWSPDALGQVLWAMTAARTLGFDQKIVEAIEQKILPYVQQSIDSRTKAYQALVFGYETEKALFAQRIEDGYTTHATTTWQWPEAELRYGNAIFPLALLPLKQELACTLLRFLNETCSEAGIPIAIGNENWHTKDGHKALFSQQPIDPAYQVLANCAAYKATGDEYWREQAGLFFSWFWGNNLLKLPIVSETRGCCFDALDDDGVSRNAGAESTVCFLLAQAAYREITQ